MRLMADDSNLPDQEWTKEVTQTTTEVLLIAGVVGRNMVKTDPSWKNAGIDQIILIVKGLLETACKWKEEHDMEAQEENNMTDLVKCLG